MPKVTLAPADGKHDRTDAKFGTGKVLRASDKADGGICVVAEGKRRRVTALIAIMFLAIGLGAFAAMGLGLASVSYTHLTLPTILRV